METHCSATLAQDETEACDISRLGRYHGKAVPGMATKRQMSSSQPGVIDRCSAFKVSVSDNAVMSALYSVRTMMMMVMIRRANVCMSKCG